MTLFCERLRDTHDTSTFACGNEDLDTWLKRSALGADRSGVSRSYIVTDAADAIVAYFALAPHLVVREETPKSIARGAPREIPAILLGKLAVALERQGQVLGAATLALALEIALEGIRNIGGRLIVVDAIDERAFSFYEFHGFQAIPGDRSQLVLKASVAAASLGVPWP